MDSQQHEGEQEWWLEQLRAAIQRQARSADRFGASFGVIALPPNLLERLLRLLDRAEGDDGQEDDDEPPSGVDGGPAVQLIRFSLSLRPDPAGATSARLHGTWHWATASQPLLPALLDTGAAGESGFLIAERAVYEAVATSVVDAHWTQVEAAWAPSGLQSWADVANWLDGPDGFKDQAHQVLVGDPVGFLAAGLGVPAPAVLSAIAVELPLAGDRLVVAGKHLIQVTGLVIGTLTGVPLIANACLRSVLYDVLVAVGAEMIEAALTGPSARSDPPAPDPVTAGFPAPDPPAPGSPAPCSPRSDRSSRRRHRETLGKEGSDDVEIVVVEPEAARDPQDESDQSWTLGAIDEPDGYRYRGQGPTPGR